MKLTVTSIYCNTACSGIQNDDVFLVIQSDAGIPVRYPPIGTISMGDKSYMELPPGGYVVEFEYGVLITAWDRDSFVFKGLDSPDYLFNINVRNTSPSTTYTAYNHNGAEYTFTQVISN